MSIKEEKTRNSNIELLKILALFLITIQHVLTSTNINFECSTYDFPTVFLALFRYSGIVGNIIFVICSSWFLIDSKNSSKKKIFYLVTDTFIISIIWLIFMLIIYHDLHIKWIIKSFFPLIFKNNWFISCYILFYLLHPFLNVIINKLSNVEHFRILCVLVIIYCMVQFIVSNSFFYNELIGFIVIYFVVSYLKKYCIKFQNSIKANVIILFLSLFINIILLLTTNFLGLRYAIFSDKVLYWSHNMCNPFSILIGISSFNIFNDRRLLHNKFINNLSSISLVYYLIHENILFRTFLRPKIYNILESYFGIYGSILILILIIFNLGLLVSLIYKYTIQKIVYKKLNIVYEKIRNYYCKFEKKLINIR